MPRRPALRRNIAQVQAGYRSADTPLPGYYRLRLVRRGPWLPARIEEIDHEPGDPDNKLDTGPILVGTIGSREVDPLQVWERGSRITEAEWRYRMDLWLWAESHPDEPAATPDSPVDLRRLPSLF